MHCKDPAGIFQHSLQPFPLENSLSSFPSDFPTLPAISVPLSSVHCGPAQASTQSATRTGMTQTETPYAHNEMSSEDLGGLGYKTGRENTHSTDSSG